MKNKKLSHNGLQGSVTSVMAALLCILIGLAVGFLVLLAINPAHAWADGFVRILKGGFHDAPYGVGKELANAAPLIMTGLSVGFAFKTGLFNIGAAGQYTLGAYGALYCAIMLKLPWFVCLLAAAILGGLWGAIPGFFKAYFNINEVITSIMFNWIGLYLVNELVYQNGTGPMYDVRNTRTLNLGKNADLVNNMTWNISTIVAEVFYCIIGLIFIATGMKALKDESCAHRTTTALFWFILAFTFIAGPYLPKWITGLCVVFLAILTAFKRVAPSKSDMPKEAETRAAADRLGYSVFIPPLVLAVSAVLVATFLKVLGANNAIGISGSIALVTAFIFFRPKAVYAVKDCTRLTDNVGVTGILPQVLAALGSVFTAAGNLNTAK